MSQKNLHNQALALTGVAQFLCAAHQIAAHGRGTQDQLDAALAAIFCTDPDTADDVLAGRAAIEQGIGFMRRQFGLIKSGSEDALVARNMGQVLRLTARLVHRQEALTGIRAAIDRARLADSSEAPAILDQAYQDHISPIPPRIMVPGHPSYLNNPVLVQQIRSHLLAAIRCAVLWRQCGGRFWHLVLYRRKYDQAVARLE